MNVNRLSQHRVLVLVDGANLRGHLQSAEYCRIDAQAFHAWCAHLGHPTIKWFQGAYPGTEAFFARLRAARIEVISKTPKTLPGGRRKADMDIEMSLAAVAAVGVFDTVLLVTADGDFAPVVTSLRSRGVDVHLLAPIYRTAGELLDAVAYENICDLGDELPAFGFNPLEAA